MTLRSVAILLHLASILLAARPLEAAPGLSPAGLQSSVEIEDAKVGTPDLESKDLVQLRHGGLNFLPKYLKKQVSKSSASPCNPERAPRASVFGTLKAELLPYQQGEKVRLCLMEYVGSKKVPLLSVPSISK